MYGINYSKKKMNADKARGSELIKITKFYDQSRPSYKIIQ